MHSIPISDLGENRLIDDFHRQYYYLRLSITDVCNFSCNYCLPNGYQPEADKPQFLSLIEIHRIARSFAQLGTEKIRITGGEPTLRKDFLAIVETLKQLNSFKQICLTTNGYKMEKEVKAWHQAGIDSINLSLDSLDAKMFYRITGVNRFDQIMRGIYKALDCGYQKIKINAVLMKGLNQQEFHAFLKWIKDKPIQMRFIELMQTNQMDDFFKRHHLSGQYLEQQLIQSGWQLQPKSHMDGPAKVFRHRDYLGELGLIMPYEKNFCASCNRLRVSAKGKLHLCLFGEEGIELRDLLQSDQQQTELETRILTALKGKREHHFLHQGNAGIRQHLASIGG